MNYSELKTQVAAYLHRTDLTAQIPTFIELAESYLFRELHIKELQVSVDGTTTGGYADLPADFGSVSRITVTYGGTNYSLDYQALAEVATASSAAPAYYALENNKLRIWGAADGQAYTLYYIPQIQHLSDSITSNWLLSNAPELYIDASCLQAAKYTRNDAEVAKLTSHVSASLDSVKRYSERRGQPATASMQIKVRRG